MPAVMGAMLVVMLISAAAIAAASGDIRLARYDQDDKNALAAAEAGVNDYLGSLNSDSNYWAKCDGVDNPAVVQKGTTGSARLWKPVPDGDSSYSIELIPAPPATECDPDVPGSMLGQGNVKIRSTGRVNGTNNYRTVTATYRRAGFLDFLYYTNFENQDRSYYQGRAVAAKNPQPNSGQPALATWLADKCERHWSGAATVPGQGRGTLPEWKGSYEENSTTHVELTIRTGSIKYDVQFPASPQNNFSLTGDGPCGEIQFASDDQVNGPFHSNDDILVCGSPEFGRPSGNDSVEISGENWRRSTSSGCSTGDPIFRPSLTKGATQLDPPATNKSLQSFTQAGYAFTGQTKIVLNGPDMTVTNNGSTQTKPLPPNGVVYVANGTCGAGYDPLDSAARPSGCGDVELSGTYSKDLTIAAENDIILTGDTTEVDQSDAMLGLISNAFVRVEHKVTNVTGDSIDTGGCDTATDSPRAVRIDAAILALKGSFTVDNYWCGGGLGNLTVNGAIAQQHRGVVGKGGNGYIKNYNYDTRMQFRSPPLFLDPIQSAWRVLRQGEQSPPQRG